jgi:hypothetical protein
MRAASHGKFGARHPLRKRPKRHNLAGNYAATCFRRRRGAPSCAGSGIIKLGKSVFRGTRHRMALEHNPRGAFRHLAAISSHATLCEIAHATNPHGELRGDVPCAGVGERPIARGRTRGMAVTVGDWRT